MRRYSCYYGMLDSKKKMIWNSNTACWRGLDRGYGDGKPWSIPSPDKKNKGFIFIKDFKEGEISDKSREELIRLINKITYCKIVKIKRTEFIKYKLLGYYYSDLLLLNMIRMMWYSVQSFDQDKFFVDIFNPHKGKDTLIFLLECVKNNVHLSDRSGYGYGNHSCIYKDIVPKKALALKNNKEASMHAFLIREK